MFGFKIVSESEYNRLTRITKEAEKRIQDAIDGRKKIESDCDSLRQQNSDLRVENYKLRDQSNKYLREVKSLREFRRDTLAALDQINLAGFRLEYCTKKCMHCKQEQPDCRKYEFGRHQYCVTPK